MTEELPSPVEQPEPPRPKETRWTKIRAGVEALLFSSSRPISEKEIEEAVEATREAVSEALESLRQESESPDRGIRLELVAGGWRYVTRPEFDSLLRKYHEVAERSRLSLAALETLSIIAYRQPITLPEIQEIRGVNSSSVVNTLFEKKLITTAGRKEVVGSPFLYRTTPEFLVRFGLKELEELPRPEELAEDMAATVATPLASESPPLPPLGAMGAPGEDDEEDDEEEYDDEDEDEDEDELDDDEGHSED
ncbi:MAG TPA: SMC-Scp complex subunit ScpB [Thermoanaerobaculia bacterium]|nr:SMC-Scp complex subunit ScpB [Thermoanaerobaculia bacterium]